VKHLTAKKEFMFACFPLIYFSKAGALLCRKIPVRSTPTPFPTPTPPLPVPLALFPISMWKRWSCTKMHSKHSRGNGKRPKTMARKICTRHILLSRLDYKTERQRQQQHQTQSESRGIARASASASASAADDVVDDMQRRGLHQNAKTHQETPRQGDKETQSQTTMSRSAVQNLSSKYIRNMWHGHPFRSRSHTSPTSSSHPIFSMHPFPVPSIAIVL